MNMASEVRLILLDGHFAENRVIGTSAPLVVRYMENLVNSFKKYALLDTNTTDINIAACRLEQLEAME